MQSSGKSFTRQRNPDPAALITGNRSLAPANQMPKRVGAERQLLDGSACPPRPEQAQPDVIKPAYVQTSAAVSLNRRFAHGSEI